MRRGSSEPTLESTLIALLLLGMTGCAPRYVIGDNPIELPVEDARKALLEKSLSVQVKPPLDRPLKLLSVDLPDYPMNVRVRNIEGNVLLSFCIEPDGSVRDISPIGESQPELVGLSVGALRRWRFAPPTRDGQALTICISHRFVFRLAN